jgi:aspartate aminotransferase
MNYLQDIPNQAVVLDSLSKRYSLCGARLGMLISLNMDLMQGVLRVAQGRLSSGLIDQVMASKLTAIPDAYMHVIQQEYQMRRNVLYEGLRTIPGVTIPKPEGAFYAIVGLPVADSEDFAKYLLTTFRSNNETVMVAPAAGFYATDGKGKNEIRIAYVLNIDALKRSIEILKEALEQYIKKGI